MDIFDRVRERLAHHKDFAPEMVYELCEAYDKRLANLERVLTTRAVDSDIQDGLEKQSILKCFKCGSPATWKCGEKGLCTFDAFFAKQSGWQIEKIIINRPS